MLFMRGFVNVFVLLNASYHKSNYLCKRQFERSCIQAKTQNFDFNKIDFKSFIILYSNVCMYMNKKYFKLKLISCGQNTKILFNEIGLNYLIILYSSVTLRI